jgi:hypothetical protein
MERRQRETGALAGRDTGTGAVVETGQFVPSFSGGKARMQDSLVIFEEQ